MENITTCIGWINDLLWSYILIISLLGCAIWFTWKTGFVQFRLLNTEVSSDLVVDESGSVILLRELLTIIAGASYGIVISNGYG